MYVIDKLSIIENMNKHICAYVINAKFSIVTQLPSLKNMSHILVRDKICQRRVVVSSHVSDSDNVL